MNEAKAEKVREELCTQLSHARLMIAEAIQVQKSALGDPDAGDRREYAQTLLGAANKLIQATAVEAKLAGVYMIEDSNVNHVRIRKQMQQQFHGNGKRQHHDSHHPNKAPATDVPRAA